MIHNYGLIYQPNDNLHYSKISGFKDSLNYEIQNDTLYHCQIFKEINLENDLIEIDILSRLHHPNILHRNKFIQNNDKILMILPLSDTILKNILNISIKQKLYIIYKLAIAFDFIHKNNILHLDINENVIALNRYDKEYYEPYIVDFGKSKIILDDQIYDNKTDIWSFGILSLNLLLNRDVNDEIRELTNDIIMFKRILIGSLPKLLEGISYKYYNNCLDLFERIFCFNSEDIVNFSDIYNHDLFKKFDNDAKHHFEFQNLNNSQKLDQNCLKFDKNISNDHNLYFYQILYDDHRQILKLLIHWIRQIYDDFDIALLFLTIDIFNRTSLHYNDDVNEKMYLAVASLYVSSKLHNCNINMNDIISKISSELPNITVCDLILHEKNIIIFLQGILYSCNLYNNCKYVEHLMLSFNKIIMSNNSMLYFDVDIEEWILSMDNHIKIPKINHKKITIKEFFG